MSTAVSLVSPFDPEGADELIVPEGSSIRDILVRAGIAEKHWLELRIVLGTSEGRTELVAHLAWHAVRPRPGVWVAIHRPPQGEGVRNALLMVVGIAATAIGQFWAGPAIAGMLGFAGNALVTGLIGAGITLGLTFVGTLLVNALIPLRPSNSNAKSERPHYVISGYQNQFTPDGTFPAVLGVHRSSPVFMMTSYQRIIGNEQYVVALFGWGHGPISISDLRVGQTPIGYFQDVQYEIRNGYAGDAPFTITPNQVVEESIGAELTRNYPRDGYGTPIEGSTPPLEPVIRVTGPDAAGASIIDYFPSGLVRYDDKGDRQAQTVQVQLRYRLAGTADWVYHSAPTITGRQAEGFFRQFDIWFPVRGKYEVEHARITPENTSVQAADRITWSALQTIRPEYPLNVGDWKVAGCAMLFKATHQLNGTLDTINAIAALVCPDWDHVSQSWIARSTKNPASLFRWRLQNASTKNLTDAELDLAGLARWHEFNRLHGLEYDRVHDFKADQEQVLADIAAAGRALSTFDGVKRGVIVDDPRNMPIVDHISVANASGFAWSKTYLNPPHAFVVKFLDETQDYRSATRIIPWPGHIGPISRVEELSLPGITNPRLVFIHARRRQLEAIYRSARYTVVQPGLARIPTRGDRVLGSFPAIADTQAPQRVKAIRDNFIALQGPVTMVDGTSYACRYRVFGEDVNGHATVTSVVRPVVTQPGPQRSIVVTGDDLPMPDIGEPVFFGRADSMDMDLIILGASSGENMTRIVEMTDTAANIDDLLDETVVPPWDGRVGGPVDDPTTPPGQPVVNGLEVLASGFTVLLRAPVSGIPTASFALRHRLQGGSGAWFGPINVPAGAGAITVSGYTAGAVIDAEVQAIGRNGVASAWLPLTSVAVPVPEGPPDAFTAGSVTAGLGSATIMLPTPADDRLAKVFILRGPTSNPTDAVEVATLPGVLPGSTYSFVDGDGTATNKIANPEFSAGGTWDLGDGWAIGTGRAIKTPGEATDISQAVSLTAGKTYRFHVLVTDRTAGSIQLKLAGGADVDGPLLSADGTAIGTIIAGAGNNCLTFSADADFDGSIDGIVLFQQSATHVPQGTHHYFLVSANADDERASPFALAPVQIV